MILVSHLVVFQQQCFLGFNLLSMGLIRLSFLEGSWIPTLWHPKTRLPLPTRKFSERGDLDNLDLMKPDEVSIQKLWSQILLASVSGPSQCWRSSARSSEKKNLRLVRIYGEIVIAGHFPSSTAWTWTPIRKPKVVCGFYCHVFWIISVSFSLKRQQTSEHKLKANSSA